MSFPQELKIALSSHSVTVDRPPAFALSSDFEQRIEELKNWCGTENGGVAVSYFFRQYALFVSAQFDMITHHGGYFACAIEELSFDRVHNYGFDLLQTHVNSNTFTEIPADRRFEAFHFVLHRQTAELIEEFRKHVKISPITLWENVLGSLLWFYANVEKRDPRRAAEDIEWLSNPENWKPMRKSYFRQLLGNTALDRAVSAPLRKTCCLYKELPHFDTCTFCPKPD